MVTDTATYLWSDQNSTLQWRNTGHDGFSNHLPHHCLLNRLFGRRSRKQQSSASLAYVRGIHRRSVNSPHKWPAMRKIIPFDDVIMILYGCLFQLSMCGYATLLHITGDKGNVFRRSVIKFLGCIGIMLRKYFLCNNRVYMCNCLYFHVWIKMNIVFWYSFVLVITIIAIPV